MLERVKCLNFGDVLIDEKRKLFVLCNMCRSEFGSLQQFGQHFSSSCSTKITKAVFDFGTTSNLNKILANDMKEYHVYKSTEEKRSNIPTVSQQKPSKPVIKATYGKVISVVDLNPPAGKEVPRKVTKSDVNATNRKYKELVDEVTPFVQFKENVKIPFEKNKNNNSVVERRKSARNIKKIEVNASRLENKQEIANGVEKIKSLKKEIVQPLPKDNGLKTIATSQRKTVGQPSKSVAVASGPKLEKNPKQALKHKTIDSNVSRPSSSTNQQRLLKISETPMVSKPIQSCPPHSADAVAAPAANQKATEQILNKLQTLGLQIKRSSSAVAATSNSQSHQLPLPSDDTLKLIRKLESKGMHIKLVHPQLKKPGEGEPMSKKPRLDGKIGELLSTKGNSSATARTLVAPKASPGKLLTTGLNKKPTINKRKL